MRWASLSVVLGLAACAHSPLNEPSDPFEPVNRKVFAFNDGLDHYVAQPIARHYVEYVPETARNGVDNFVNNATYFNVILNDALQGKFKQFFQDIGRFAFNSIVGIGGFVDAASMIGLEEHDEDLGQTFGYWGLGNGPFLMLPFIGPSSNRDFAGSIAGIVTHPATYLPFLYATTLDAAEILNERSHLLQADSILSQQLDKYIFVRNAYLQHRQNLIYDGAPPLDLDGFDEMEADPVMAEPSDTDAAEAMPPAETASGAVPSP